LRAEGSRTLTGQAARLPERIHTDKYNPSKSSGAVGFFALFFKLSTLLRSVFGGKRISSFFIPTKVCLSVSDSIILPFQKIQRAWSVLESLEK